MPSNLLVLLPTDGFGGHEKMLIRWLRTLLESGEVCCTLHYGANENLEREVRGLEAVAPARVQLKSTYREKNAFARLLNSFRALKRARGEVVLLAPGVIQSQSLHLFLAALLRRRVVVYVPMVFSSDVMGFRWPWVKDLITRLLVRRQSMWICVTSAQVEVLRSVWKVRKPIVVIPNWLGEPKSRAEVVTRERDILRILYLGRFDANQKGLDWLIRGLRSWPQEWRGEFRFKFQGMGGFELELNEFANLFPEEVEVAPWSNGEDSFSECDVLILPSRFEGFPLVAIEATQAGIPVVASRSAGLVEVLPRTAVFECGDFVGLMAALRRLRAPNERMLNVQYARNAMSEQLSEVRFRDAVTRVGRELARISAS